MLLNKEEKKKRKQWFDY